MDRIPAEDDQDEEDSSVIVLGSAQRDDSSTEVQDAGHDYHIDNRFFLFIRNKQQLHADRLVDEVHSVLLKAFPDHLHWAGLELAAKTRDTLPEIIGQKLPRIQTAL